jgi:adenine-specific DNA-methyltransferase
MLIHGDNLLALKALENKYTGKIKCVAIDPPYNTGAAFEHYDDNLEHSIWLNLMYQRIKLLHKLISLDGSMWIVIDDKELHYLKIICDEIFGRDNFICTIAVKSSTPSGVKTAHKEKTIIKQKDYLLIYRKSDKFRINPQFIRKNEWDTHFNYFLNPDLKTVSSFTEILKDKGILKKEQSIRDFNIDNPKHRDFYLKNADFICQTQSHKNEDLKEKSRLLVNEVMHHNGMMFFNGRQLTPLSNSLNEVVYNNKIENDFAILLCDFWSDVDFQNTQNEGSVSFPNSKKPEALIYRILKMATNENDIVLDSFLGSGTTAAVSHKINRQWIGIELGEHAKSHCLPRLKNIIKGKDSSGITEIVNWKGGGGFKFYTLAPSLLNQDKFGNWVISTEYNAQMLAAAMTKQEGFNYQPDEHIYWKQGRSSEHDYIYVTTQFLTVEVLESIHDEMQPGESLLVCCKAFQKECKHKYPNITLKKIPQMLLGRCEFGKDDYSLNIVNMPVEEKDEIELDVEFEETKESVQEPRDKIIKNNELTLFD